MEPRLPTPNAGLERPSLSYERQMDNLSSVRGFEGRIEQVAENFEKAETNVDNSSVQPILPPPTTVPVQVNPVRDDNTLATPSDNTPLVANDDDLIEKEWVDKAKQIILDTRDDPYRREQEVGRLQADYLRKRYGRELGDQY